MTTTLYLLIWVAVALSLGHHADHILRGDTGWPFSGEVNTFSYSLVIYPIILTGLALSLFGLVGPRFWAFISLGGAAFVAAVHLGPVSSDAITEIPGRYSDPLAGALAVVVLVALVAVLVGTFGYETRLAARSRRNAAMRAEQAAGPARQRAPAAGPEPEAGGVRRAGLRDLLGALATVDAQRTVIDFGSAVPLYVAGLVGPALAASSVTAATEGRSGLRDLLARTVRWRVGRRWYAIAVGVPLALGVLAVLITVAFGAPWPDLAGFGVIAGLPATSAVVIVRYAVVVNGLGEEIGWRGFALPALQRSLSPLTAVVVLSLVWAGWHLPLLPLLTSFRVISGPALLPLFWFGMFTLTVVLAWIYNRSGGSILMAALFHGLYNVIAGTAAALGGLNTIFTVFLMVWATALVVLDVRARRAGRADSPLRPVDPASLSSRPSAGPAGIGPTRRGSSRACAGSR